MEPDAIAQLKSLLTSAPELREKLSNTDRLQLLGLTQALSNELERPDEAVFRITFNQVCFHVTVPFCWVLWRGMAFVLRVGADECMK
jgi:hypothetical protein